MIYNDSWGTYYLGAMLNNIRALYFILSLCGGIYFMPTASHAADYSHGDACTAAGAFHQTNDATGLDFLICDGSNWKSVLFFDKDGNNLRLDNDPGAGSAGCIQYDGTGGKLQYSHDCTSFSDFGASGGGGGTAIIDQIESSGMTIDAVTISSTSNKWPDYIVCANDIAEESTLFLSVYENTGVGTVQYTHIVNGQTYEFEDDGTYVSRGANLAANCGAAGNDIDSICDDNRCNFFGAGGGGLSADAVLESHLKAVDAAADEECLTYETTTGDFEWQACSGGSAAGADKQIQFNDGGSAFGGDADFVWDKTGNKLTVTGDIDYTGVITDISDRNLKENITPLQNSLETIQGLQGYSFTMKGDESGEIEYGLIAQEVEPGFPHLVKTKDNGTKSLNYIGLIAPMVEAIKELRAENKELKVRVEALEGKQLQNKK